MTRKELEKLKEAKRKLHLRSRDWLELSAYQILHTLIVDAEAEHAAEDRHHEWSELDQATLAKVA